MRNTIQLIKKIIQQSLQYIIALLFLLVAMGEIHSGGSWISALLILAAGSLTLPSVRPKLQNTLLKDYKVTALVMVSLLVFSQFIAAPQREVNEKKEIENAAVAKEARQAERLKSFAEDPDAVIRAITDFIDQKNYAEAIRQAEYYLQTNNEKIKELHEIAIEEDKKILAKARIENETKSKEILYQQKVASWDVVRTESDMDGSPAFIISRKANNGIQAWLRSAHPEIVIRCHENGTDFILRAGTNFAVVYGEYNKASIRYRIDSRPPVSELWSESTDGEAVFAAHPIALIKKLKDAELLRIELNPFNESPQTVDFDVMGIKPHLEELAKTCKWQL